MYPPFLLMCHDVKLRFIISSSPNEKRKSKKKTDVQPRCDPQNTTSPLITKKNLDDKKKISLKNFSVSCVKKTEIHMPKINSSPEIGNSKESASLFSMFAFLVLRTAAHHLLRIACCKSRLEWKLQPLYFETTTLG